MRLRSLRRRVGSLTLGCTAAALLAAALPAASLAGDPPTISIADTGTGEPDKGQTSTQHVQVSVSGSAPGATVHYQLVAGTATAGTDFVMGSGTVTFDAGSLTKSIPVQIKGDNRDEQNETLFVKLSSPIGATIADPRAKVTIVDDDGPMLTINPPVKPELGPDQHPRLVFRLVLSKPGVETIKVTVTPKAGTLQPGAEVTLPAARTFTFAPGETVRTYRITTTGDRKDEVDEDVRIDLTNMVNVIGPMQVKGTITDDDCNGTDPGADDAEGISQMRGDQQEVRTVSSSIACNGEHDWYRVRLVEHLTAINDATPLTARIRLNVGGTPAQGGGDLDLCVYRKTILDADTLIGCSSNTGLADELIELRNNDSIITDDSRTVWIRVLHHGITQGPNRYTLAITSGVAVSVGDNL